MKNLFCRHLLTAHYPMLPLEEMEKEWHTKCANRKTVSGYPVHLFPPSALEERGGHCIRPDQFYFLREDPHTGRKLTKLDKQSFKKKEMTVPATQEYNPRLCPVRHRLRSDKGPFVFLVSPFPVRTKRDLPDSVVVRSGDWAMAPLKPVVLLDVRPSYIFSMHYYLIRLVGGKTVPSSGKRIKKENIRAIYPLYDKETVRPTMNRLNDRELLAELKQYFTYSIVRFSSATIDALRGLKLRLPEPVRVFRGVFIHNLAELKAAKLEGITTGGVVEIDSRDLPVSWSTDSCISQFFATHTPARRMLGTSSVQFGIVFSTVLEPEQVALDTRLFDTLYFRTSVYRNDQQEVITFPTTPDGRMNKFECKVERLFLIDRVRQKVVIVHSFKEIVPFI